MAPSSYWAGGGFPGGKPKLSMAAGVHVAPSWLVGCLFAHSATHTALQRHLQPVWDAPSTPHLPPEGIIQCEFSSKTPPHGWVRADIELLIW